MNIVQPLKRYVQRKMIQMSLKACKYVAGEVQAAINDVHDLNIVELDDFDLKEWIEKLNSDQCWVFKNISGHLYHQWQHKQGICDYANGDTKCVVGTPTGIASYNIGGVTVHY